MSRFKQLLIKEGGQCGDKEVFECLLSCDWLFATPKDCSPPGSSIHGIFQARVLEWGATAFSRSGMRTHKLLLFDKSLCLFSSVVSDSLRPHGLQFVYYDLDREAISLQY